MGIDLHKSIQQFTKAATGALSNMGVRAPQYINSIATQIEKAFNEPGEPKKREIFGDVTKKIWGDPSIKPIGNVPSKEFWESIPKTEADKKMMSDHGFDVRFVVLEKDIPETVSHIRSIKNNVIGGNWEKLKAIANTTADEKLKKQIYTVMSMHRENRWPSGANLAAWDALLSNIVERIPQLMPVQSVSPKFVPPVYKPEVDSTRLEGPQTVQVTTEQKQLESTPDRSNNQVTPIITRSTFIAPRTGYFGAHRSHGSHAGVDLMMPIGTPLFAPKGAEKVVFAGRLGNYGNVAVIQYRTDNGTVRHMFFAHCKEFSNEFRSASSDSPIAIRPGMQFALSGNTGNASSPGSPGPHVHFEIMEQFGVSSSGASIRRGVMNPAVQPEFREMGLLSQRVARR